MYGQQTGKCCNILYVIRDISVQNRLHFFEALNYAYEVQFFRGSFLHQITDTDIM